MKRRKFLLTSGTAILGSTALNSISQQPALGLNFDLVGVENIQPSNVNSILIDFQNFELIPKYVDEGNATVTVTLDIDGFETVENQTTVNLQNGATKNKSDLGSAIPIVLDEINTNESTLNGTIKIDIQHPSISDSYTQSFTITDDTLQQGLIGYWPLHEWQGQANDISNNNNHGNVNSVTQGANGISSLTGYRFDGSNDYILMPFTNDLLKPKGTISFWFKPLVPQSEQQKNSIIMSVDNPGTDRSWDFRWGEHQSNDIRFRSHGNLNIGDLSETIEPYEWHHVTLRYEEVTTAELFINGTSSDSSSINVFDDIDIQMAIGSREDGSANLKMGLSNLRIYNRKLTDKEISKIHNIGTGNYTSQSLHDGSDPSGISRWNFDNSDNSSISTDVWSTYNGSNNGTTYTEDSIRGKALSFNGSSYVNVNHSSFQPSELTVSAWVKFNENITSRQQLISKRVTGSSYGWRLMMNDDQYGGDLIMEIIDGDGNYLGAGTEFKPSKGSWYHVVGTYKNGTAKTFINGVLSGGVNKGGLGISYSSENINIGRSPDGAEYLSGMIDDVRIYDRVLELNEIFQLYQWGTKGKDLRERTTTKNKSDLTAWWKLNETSGNTAYDSSGNSNNGNITGVTPNQTIDPTGSNAYGFDGDQDYITVSNTGTSSPVTVTAWMYPRSSGENDYGRIFDQRDDFDLALGDGQGHSILWEINNTNYWFGSSPLDKNNWYHLSATIDKSGTGRVYINGQLLESKTVEAVNPSSNDAYIGCMEGSARWFDGYISNVQVYNRQLTPQEISYLYEQKF